MKLKPTPLSILLPPTIPAILYCVFLTLHYRGMAGDSEQITGAAALSALIFYPVGLLILAAGAVSMTLTRPSLPPLLKFVVGGILAGAPLLLQGDRSCIQSLGFMAFCALSALAMYPLFVRLAGGRKDRRASPP